MRDEYRMFKCWRYKVNTTIQYRYDTSDDGNEYLVFSLCSLRESGKKCMGMEDVGRPCGLIQNYLER